MRDTATMLDDLKLWVEHETPTPFVAGINALSCHIEGECRSFGAHTRRFPGQDGFGDHLLATSPGDDARAPVLILTHIDTVHPVGTLAENPFRIDGDRAYGPGIYDMKGGAYLAHRGLADLVAAGSAGRRRLQVLYTADEEVGSPTSRTLIEQLAAGAHAVLVVEPARGGGKIVTARRGVARYAVHFQGRPAHSGTAHALGRSAIKEMARQILDWEGFNDPDRNISLNVGVVAGGTAMNVIPEHAEAHVDIRLPNSEVTAEVIARFEASRPYDEDVRLTLDGGVNRPAFAPNAATDALFERAAPIAERHGFALAGVHTGGGSDGNFTFDAAPTLDGLGVDGDGAHTKNEHLRVSSLAERGGFLRDLAATLLADP